MIIMSKIPQLVKLLEQNENDCFLLHALGLEYIKIGETEKGIAYFQKVLMCDENYVGTYYHLAKSFEKKQMIQKALDTYIQGMEIAKRVNDKHAYNELLMAYEELNDE